jgi:hypothetical protein
MMQLYFKDMESLKHKIGNFGVVECKVYHNALMNTKSQIDFDRLLQLHMFDKIEEDKDSSWECCKVVDYFKDKGDVNSSKHKCLAE